MKKELLSVITVALLTIALIGCEQNASKKVNQENVEQTAQNTETTSENPIMTFESSEYNFGVINEGQTVETTFKFTNTGKSDLLIVDARGSCGCTVPSYPKNTAIAPGESGEIVVEFNSSGKPGKQQKTVTLSANTDTGREMLRIKAEVTPDPAMEKQREEMRKARAQQQQNQTNN